MNRWLFSGLICLALTALVPGALEAQRPATLDAAAIMERNFQASKVTGVRMEATMVLINDKGQQRERRNTSVVALQPNGVDSVSYTHLTLPTNREV